MPAIQAFLPALPNNDNQPISTNELSDKITLLAGQINAATYRFLKLIAEFDRREGWNGSGIRNCAHWLNWKCGITLGAAREKLRVAHCLEQLPKINPAFAKGEISYSKARALTRVATDEKEEFLLMIAKHGTASHIEKLVRKYQAVESRNKPEQEKQLRDSREMVSYQADDGMWVIHAKLPAEEGALVVKTIDAILYKQKAYEQKQALETTNEPKSENVPAETFSEVASKSSSETDLLIVKQGEYPYAKKRADALLAMAEHYLSSVTDGEGRKSLAGSERCQVILHVDINTLKSHSLNNQTDCCDSHANHYPNPQNEHCNLDNKQWISPETARRLSCDATLVSVLEDNNGNVLNIGRRSRTIPPHIQRALTIRDTSCQFPGCCSSRYLDAHHLKHWADGGETKMDNLVMLCKHHHRGLHSGDYSMQVEEQSIVFKTAEGKHIEQSFYPQFPYNVVALNSLDKTLASIDKNTAVSKWQGEKMDYDMAINGLASKKAVK